VRLRRKQPGCPELDLERWNSRLYLIGLGASVIGDSAMSLVAGIWVKSLTGSNRAAALVAVCVYAPSLLAPLAGLVADRVRRRRLLVGVNLVAAAWIVQLLFVHSSAQAWLIFSAMLGYGTAAVLTDPAENALFAAMLSAPARRRINGKRLALQESGKLVAPLAGAALFAAFGGGSVAALDAATFLVAAAAIWRLRVPDPRPQRSDQRWRAELTAGVRHIRAVAPLRRIVLAGSVAMAVSGVAVAAQYGLVDALHRPPAFLGVLTGALGAGSIIGGLTSGRVIGLIGETGLAVAGLADGVLGNVLRATGWLPTALAGSFVMGFALPWTVVAVITLSQRLTPDALQGRVAAAVGLALFAPQPLALTVGAATIDALGYRGVLAVAAGSNLVVGWWLFSRRQALAARTDSPARDHSPAQ